MSQKICVYLSLAAALLASACSHDATSPERNELEVTLAVDVTPTPTITDTPNGPKISCDVHLTASAKGKGVAAWTGAIAYWFIGTNRTTPIDSTLNPGSDVAEGFNGDGGISAGDTEHTIWSFYDSVPFEVSFGFTYKTDQGKIGVASARFLCGPGPTGAVAPTITAVSVPSLTGELKAGDTVTVQYQETSTSGVWLTDIQAVGAFVDEQFVGEHLATSVNRAAKFVVPVGAAPNIPLAFFVRAYDAALEGTTRTFQTQLVFIDRTPPWIGGAAFLHLAGQYAVGDTMSISIEGDDDNALGWLVWQLGAPANASDSVAATPRRAQEMLDAHIIVRPEWVGTPQLSIYVRDAAGLTSPPVTSAPDSVRFYPTVDQTTTAPLILSSSADMDDIAYDAKRDLMFVSVPDDHRVVVFSPTTMALQTPIDMPAAPGGMDLSVSGDSLLVTVPAAKSIAVIDLNNPAAPPSMVRLSVLDTAAVALAGTPLQPTDLRIAANGKIFVMLSWATTTNDQVMEVDVTNGAQRFRTDARNVSTALPFWTRYTGRTDDRQRIYILGACGMVYDAVSDTFAGCTNGSGSTCKGMTFDASGTIMTRGGDVRNPAQQGLYYASGCTAISSDGATLYSATTMESSLRSMRFSDRVMLERISLPLTPTRLFAAPNGNWVLAFHETSGARATRVDVP